MSIDPNTPPDGTVVETNDGGLHFKDGDGRQLNRGYLGDGGPLPWGDRAIVRTYAPDDADLIEAMARGMYATLYPQAVPWDDRDGLVCDTFRTEARAALAVVREHEATR